MMVEGKSRKVSHARLDLPLFERERHCYFLKILDQSSVIINLIPASCSHAIWCKIVHLLYYPLLHRYQGWASASVPLGDDPGPNSSSIINPPPGNEEPSSAASATQQRKEKGGGPKPLPFIQDKLGKALPIIHTHEPTEALSLKPAIATDLGVHAHAQLISYQPPQMPFAGDYSQDSHSLNDILLMRLPSGIISEVSIRRI
jgi:hypothetical protein